MAKNLSNSATSFQKINLSYTEYQQSKINSSEISFNGNLYDIKSSTITGDRIELLVIDDKQEKNIIDAIKGYFNSASPANKKLPLTLKQMLTLDYLLPETKHTSHLSISSSMPFVQPDQQFNSIDQGINAPPPRLV